MARARQTRVPDQDAVEVRLRGTYEAVGKVAARLAQVLDVTRDKARFYPDANGVTGRCHLHVAVPGEDEQ